MKKNIFKILIFAFILLGFNNVYAVTADTNLSSLPINTTTGDTGYDYTINSFAIRIYDIDMSNDKSVDNYVKETPDRVIELNNVSGLTIMPRATETTINNIPTTVIDLNLNLTTDKLRELLDEEIRNTTSEKGYLVEVVYRYKLTKLVQNADWLTTVNTYRNKIATDETVKLKRENLNQEIVQTLNAGVLSYNNQTNEVEFLYSDDPIDDRTLVQFVINYLMLSSYNSEGKNVPHHLLMFHNVENMDKIITRYENDEIFEEDDNNGSNNQGQNVIIPNTASKISSYFYIISVLMIIIGAFVITKTLVRND